MGAVLIVGGEVFEHFRQPGKHPPVATRPEVFLTVSGLVSGPHILAVAKIEFRLSIIHDAVADGHILIELVEIFLVTGDLIHLGHNRHNHI